MKSKFKTAGVRLYAAMTFALVAIAAHAGAPDDSVGRVEAKSAGPLATTDRVIVHYRQKPGVIRSADVAMLASRLVHDASNLRGFTTALLHVTGLGSQVWQMNKSMSLVEAAALSRDIAAKDSDVEYAEPDRVLFAQLTPNDPYFSGGSQWDLFQATAGINVQPAWDLSTGFGVTIAVIDTGYRPHVDLAANIVTGYDFISNVTTANDGDGRDSSPLDPGDAVAAGACSKYPGGKSSEWHGTHVAGTVGALTNNATGVAGVAFGAKVQPVRVLGRCGGYTSDIADAIAWASGGSVSGVPANPTPARVINLSLSGPGACGPTFAAAVQTARNRGAVVVAAAGNDGIDVSNAAPANCPGVLAIASVGSTGAKASDSNYGAHIALAAPGVGIVSTYNTGTTAPATDTYAAMSGTSMASPHAAGVAALMLSANSSLRVDDVEWKLIHSARTFPVACSGCGAGLLDASNAVNSVVGYSPSPVPLLTVTLVGGDGNGGGSWQIANSRSAPVVLSDITTVSSNASVSITGSSCTVGGWLAAGAACTVSTAGAASCSGGSYLLKATNSAGVANGNAWVEIPYQSCGG